MVVSEKCRELRKKLWENTHEAMWIIEHITGIKQGVINDRELTESEIMDIDRIVQRRLNGEPLQYILGNTEFMGLKFIVNRHTLIPRQDTETLVETAVSVIEDRKVKVLDIGTGSGCVGISIAEFCKNASVTMLDTSEEALAVAKENARLNGVRADFVKCDIMHDIADGEFDIIVSNPPYIRTQTIEKLDSEVKDYEPVIALDGGDDGLMFYRRISHIFSNVGTLIFEIGYDMAELVDSILRDEGFVNTRIIRDLCDNNRVILAHRNEQNI